MQWLTPRRSCARATHTNKTVNIAVGTVKESTATRLPRLPRWSSRKVRQVCDNGVRRRTMRLETVAWEILRPCLWSSP